MRDGQPVLSFVYDPCHKGLFHAIAGKGAFGYELYNWIAGALLIQEAGGVVSDSHGETFTWGTSGIIAANSDMHQEIKKELQTM